MVPKNLLDGLLASIKSTIDKTPKDQYDWHPNTNQQVLNIIHPSMYCLEFGQTLGYSEPLSMTDPTSPNPPAAIPPPDSDEAALSTRFSWLPTAFDVAEDGSRVTALNYINSMTPLTDPNLTPQLESLLALFIPLFSRVMFDLENPLPPISQESCTRDQTGRPEYDPTASRADGYWDKYEAQEEVWQRGAALIQPDLPNLHERPLVETRGADLTILNGTEIKVITKIAEIRLTPDRPEYSGGSWHVVGPFHPPFRHRK